MADGIQIEGGGQLITVSQQLRESNEQQGELISGFSENIRTFNNPALDLLTAINLGIKELNRNFMKFLDQAELDRLKMLEQQRESVGPTTPDVEAPEKEDKSFFQKIKEWIESFKENFLLSLAAGLTALTASNFGFTGFEVKILKDIKERFAKVGTRISTFFSGVATKISEFFKPVKEFFTKFLPDPEKSSKALTKLRELFKPVSDMLGKFTGALSRFGGLVMRILRPLALGMAAFDGFRNARAEYEESGNMLTTVGNFLTGFVGSFIGEFINLIRDMITGAIRWIFPESTKDGTFLNDVLTGLEEMNFATMIVDGWNMIFDMIAGAIDSVKAWFTETYESIKESVMEAAKFLGIGVDPDEKRGERLQVRYEQERETLQRLEEEGGSEEQIVAAKKRVNFRAKQLGEIGFEAETFDIPEKTESSPPIEKKNAPSDTPPPGLESPYQRPDGTWIDLTKESAAEMNRRDTAAAYGYEYTPIDIFTGLPEGQQPKPEMQRDALQRNEQLKRRNDPLSLETAPEKREAVPTNLSRGQQMKEELLARAGTQSIRGGASNIDNSTTTNQAITVETPSALDGLGHSYWQ